MDSDMQKLAFTLASATALLLGSATAQADFVGIYASADYWNVSGTSEIAKAGTPQQSFDHQDKGLASIVVSVEHPAPLIPNARVRHVQLKRDDSAQSSGFDFANSRFFDSRLETDLASTDLLAYYEILDNVVSVDVGLGAKLLNGDLSVTSNSIAINSQTVKIKETLPVAYASVGGSLPFTGFSVKAEAIVGQNQDAKTSDLQAEIKYNFVDNIAVDLGLKAGYRILNIELDNVKNTDGTFDFKGPYLGLEIHF